MPSHKVHLAGKQDLLDLPEASNLGWQLPIIIFDWLNSYDEPSGLAIGISDDIVIISIHYIILNLMIAEMIISLKVFTVNFQH